MRSAEEFLPEDEQNANCHPGQSRIVSRNHAQEASALLECLGSQPRYLFERLAGAEGTMGVAVQDNILSQSRSDS